MPWFDECELPPRKLSKREQAELDALFREVMEIVTKRSSQPVG